MVFFQHCFHLEQHCFHHDRQFSCSPNISNWLSRVPTQSSLVIQNYCSSDYPVLYPPYCTGVLSSVLKSYHYIFHYWCQVRFTYIISTNVCQLQTSFTPIYFVHPTLLSIPYKMHSPYNVSGMVGKLTIISHAHGRFAIQDNQRSFLWNHVWILIQQFMS